MPSGAEHPLGGEAGGEVAAEEEAGLRVRAGEVEVPVQRLRDVPGPLDQEAERDPAADQPVEGRDVAAQVAPHEDRPATGPHRGPSSASPRTSNRARSVGIGGVVEEEVARQEPDPVGREGGPDGVGGQSAPRACFARTSDRVSSRRLGGQSAAISRPRPPRTASARGAQAAERRQQEAVEPELPAEEAAEHDGLNLSGSRQAGPAASLFRPW